MSQSPHLLSMNESKKKSLPKEVEQLLRGVEKVVEESEFLEKLKLGRPLKVKLGVDPTSPDIHLGHTLGLTKLRQFQDFGHQAVLIIGDFTAMIGDPSGRSVTRPQLTHDQVMQHAATYRDQAMKILDPEKTIIRFNGEWFELMSFEDVIKLNSRVTLQQMLQREDFSLRLAKGHPIRAHEIQYPIMQGWDSVMIRADVELGGTDQLFNIMVGRNLQKEEGQPRQVGIFLPILEGTDGIQKMSKSLNNYIGVTEPPGEMFGKLMNISDSLMLRYYDLLLQESPPADTHPMVAKKELARRITARFHSQADAARALEEFERRFSARDLEAVSLPEFSLSEDSASDVVSIVCAAYARCFNINKSKSEVRRLLAQGSVRINGEKLSDPLAKPELPNGIVLRLDKTRAVRILRPS